MQISQARRLIGDFAIPLAILIMVVLDIIIKDTYTEVRPFAKLTRNTHTFRCPLGMKYSAAGS